MSGNDFNHTRTVTARKARPCEECGRRIEPGEKYETTAAVYWGEFFTSRACAHCAVARQIVAEASPDYMEDYYGGLSEWLGEVWRDHDDLTRLAACMRARWRYQSGALMPVPERAS